VLAAWIVLLTGIFAAFDSNYLRAFQNITISILIFGVWYGLRRFSKKYQQAQNNKISYLKWSLLIVFVASIVVIKTTMFPADLRQLSRQREAVFEHIQPAFLQYKQQYHKFPKLPEALVPEFLKNLPAVLNNKNFDKAAYQVKYWRSADGLNAKYIYRDCLGPDCRASFNLLTGEKWHDK